MEEVFVNAESRSIERWVDRYFHNCDQETKEGLIEVFRSGYMIDQNLLNDNAVPAVLVLATWLRVYRGIEVVEDYEDLIAYQTEIFGICASPVLYLSSCICILYARGEHPGEFAFKQERVPEIYKAITAKEVKPSHRRKR